MYRKCAVCEDLGVSCRKVDILSMNTSQVVEFLKIRKRFIGVSHQNIADATGVPFGTVSRFFSFDPATDTVDFKFDTIRRIAAYLMGYVHNDEDCPTAPQTLLSIQQLETALKNAEQRREEEVSKVRAEMQTKIDFLREQVKFKEEQMANKDKVIEQLVNKLK